jgi:histidinol-phosphate/aromatic aminotransferase/cobyric acid decarboxylase-like protein/GNAT superfamily N-acetyltransferase
MRHDVYALELGQHAARAEKALSDGLDATNRYLVAHVDGRLAGFVSITCPGGSYSIDKYVARTALPFTFDDGLYEIRILTVAPAFRGSPLAFLLMYAAYREVESAGGTRVMAIGRREVVGLYERIGMTAVGEEFLSGAVTFQPMQVTIERLRMAAARHAGVLERLAPRVRWNLPGSFLPQQICTHGGAFFKGIGERFDSLERRHEVIAADVLDAWFPPAPGVLESLRDTLDWIARTSPPAAAEGLLRTISSVRDLPIGALLPGAGSSDLIYRVLPFWLSPGSRVLILDPMYGEYAHILEVVIGCTVDRFVLKKEEGYLPDTVALAEALARGYDLVVIVNPNSPTGVYLDSSRIESLIDEAPAGTRFWIDETYIEYLPGGRSLERFAAAGSNTIVCKSMSKVYALSGLRVAYLCGAPELLAPLRRRTPPWIVGLAAQIAAVRALEDPGHYSECYRMTHENREWMMERLRGAGLDIFSGATNSLLLLTDLTHHDPDSVIARCRERNLYLRDATEMGWSLPPGTIRIAVKDAATNERIVSILAEVLDTPSIP